jgi:hypothetical protein
MHCGFRLPPNHTGPCPNCGKTGTSAEVFGYGSSRATVQAIVNTSGSSVFASHNTPVPDWWPEATEDMTNKVIPLLQNELQNEVRTALEQHDRDIEKREKSPRNRLIRVGITLFWILVGIVLTWLASRFL